MLRITGRSWCWLALPVGAVGCQWRAPAQPLTLVLSVPATAEPTTRPAVVTAPVPPVAVVKSHVIRPFDLLEVTTTDADADHPAGTNTELLRVQGDGSIRLVMVGPVAVGGLTRSAAEAAVVEAFRVKQIAAKPAVRIFRRQTGGSPGAPSGPIRAGDLLHVVVRDVVGPNTTSVVDRRVGESGELNLPLAGPLKVVGLTDPQVAELIVATYADRQIVAHAAVDVATIETAPAGIDPLDLPDGPVGP